jgi:MFS family permease
MIIFTAFNSLQNIVSKLYDDYGYKNLGQTGVLCLYLSFAIATLFTSYIIKHFGYNRVMFCSSLGYGIFELTGLFISLEFDIPKVVGWIVVIFGSCCCGISASMIWVAQGAYVSQVAGEERKSELFGLFWSLMMSSQILGNLITTFVLGVVGQFTYFLVLTILGCKYQIIQSEVPSYLCSCLRSIKILRNKENKYL